MYYDRVLLIKTLNLRGLFDKQDDKALRTLSKSRPTSC